MALGWRGQYARYKEFFLNVLSLYKKRADLRMFLETILTLSTIIVFSLFALKPTILTIISLTKEISEKESLVSALDRKINNLQRASETYDNEQQNVPIIQISIPDSASPDLLVRQIEGLANKNSVRVLGISFGETVLMGSQVKKKSNNDLAPLPEGAEEIPTSISISAPYQNLYAMVKDIENLRIPVKIDILGINASDTDAGRIIVAALSGRIPFIKNEN